MIKIHFVDTNPKIVAALAARFAPADGYPDVVISKKSVTELHTDVIVTPTNAHGNMNGGVDAALKNLYGVGLEQRLKAEIRKLPGGTLDVGEAVVCQLVPGAPRYLVAAATMVGEGDDISRTINSALACAAAFQAIYTAVARSGNLVETVAIPGLGGGTGKVSPQKVAEMLHVGYTLFRRRRYADTSSLLDALKEELNARSTSLLVERTIKPVILPDKLPSSAPAPAVAVDPFLAFASEIE